MLLRRAGASFERSATANDMKSAAPMPSSSPDDPPGAASDSRAVLLDDPGEDRWRREMSPRPIFTIVPGVRDSGLEWMNAWLASSDARRSCCEWAASRLHVSPEVILSVSAPLKPEFTGRLLAACGSSFPYPSTAAGSKGHADNFAPAEPEVCAALLCAEALGWTREPLRDSNARWTAFFKIAPSRELPAFILDSRSDLPSALGRGDRFALLGATLGLRAAPDAWRLFLAGDRWDRCATRWRMARLFSAESVTPARAEKMPSETTRQFVAANAPGSLGLLNDASALLAKEKSRGDDALSSEARSAVEALLFAVLNSRPFTRGRFRLNAPMPFTFGPRAAEADLAALDARFVVEIDGYYHFRDEEAYRRDRRKDALYQEHGWFFLRILAQDVTLRLESVVTSIEQTLARRDSTASLRHPTP